LNFVEKVHVKSQCKYAYDLFVLLVITKDFLIYEIDSAKRKSFISFYNCWQIKHIVRFHCERSTFSKL